tara:strand:+ start:2105 stop:2278 length:174 start_codon:yes stop_codon:yes gene_type:complete
MTLAALIYLAYALMTIGIAYGQDGETRKVDFVNTLGKQMLLLLILLWGGFFNGIITG